MPHVVVQLHMLGAADEPEWCGHCALPSAIRMFYAITCGDEMPSSIRSFTACADCGRQTRS